MNEKDKLPKPLTADGEGRDSAPPRQTATSAREAWRVFGIMSEFVEATERLAAIRPAVSIFGSARIAPDSGYYQLTEKIARLLSDAGFSVISGGGPGVMEAANKGAFDGKSLSIGLNIQLPHEQTGQSVSGHLADLPPLLRPQVHVRQSRRRLRGDARRLRHAGRIARGADPDPDRQDAAHSADSGRHGVLGRPARLVPRTAGGRENDQSPKTSI